ncbi:MAG: cbb3-type cytochrome c oxidase subunit 3 [Desulfuromonadales bacterium]|nr:cbb3-type cytochrome c oxidase subunit 3 [Desulfuromonadales bacterium]NIR34460.1 cbb3-type cytochrome c oxidase subunit 3 [Desulfuromonadales bacterium]NIS42997.1 cbb3-type cytochrome c oxidase subunit 3 [Desulfuromonadales bacterium]
MDWASIFYLGVTFGLFIVFALIVFRTCRGKNRKTMEDPKHRMLDDD